MKDGSVETIGGEMVEIEKSDDGEITVSYRGNAANIVSADIQATNGIIHVIDRVIY